MNTFILTLNIQKHNQFQIGAQFPQRNDIQKSPSAAQKRFHKAQFIYGLEESFRIKAQN